MLQQRAVARAHVMMMVHATVTQINLEVIAVVRMIFNHEVTRSSIRTVIFLCLLSRSYYKYTSY